MLSRLRTSCVGRCWNGKDVLVPEDEREPKKPSVLPAREAMALIGQEPPESEPPDDEQGEPPPADVGGDPTRS
jgi:hypothetical protein